jgi:putative addiction module component (TIGR02574 family)
MAPDRLCQHDDSVVRGHEARTTLVWGVIDLLTRAGVIGYSKVMTTQTVIELAMALPLQDRIGLAEALWQNISEGLAASDPLEAIQQASRRAAELISGTVSGRSHEEVMQAARRAIGCD